MAGNLFNYVWMVTTQSGAYDHRHVSAEFKAAGFPCSIESPHILL
jgi:hypothetical protein